MPIWFAFEAEEAVLELTQRMSQNRPYADVQNIWLRENGNLIKNRLRPLTKNLDYIPFPDYDLEDHYISTEDNTIKKMGCLWVSNMVL